MLLMTQHVTVQYMALVLGLYLTQLFNSIDRSVMTDLSEGLNEFKLSEEQ